MANPLVQLQIILQRIFSSKQNEQRSRTQQEQCKDELSHRLNCKLSKSDHHSLLRRIFLHGIGPKGHAHSDTSKEATQGAKKKKHKNEHFERGRSIDSRDSREIATKCSRPASSIESSIGNRENSALLAVNNNESRKSRALVDTSTKTAKATVTNISKDVKEKIMAVKLSSLEGSTKANQKGSRSYNRSINRMITETQKKPQLPTYAGLEKYELLSKMGDGAYSNVFKAKGKSSDAKVAIKVINKAALLKMQLARANKSGFKPSRNEASNILKEVQIMRQLNHKNIVKLIDFIETDDYFYLVLELCEGGELFQQILRYTYFSEDLSRHIIVQVAEAIRYLHEEVGVVHRDIKPENILFNPIPFVPSKSVQPSLLDKDKLDEGEFIRNEGGAGIGAIKIADFGLSKIIYDKQTQTPCGTVGYTAPEILNDQRYTKSVDIWALGCVLYTLLCGFPPFYDDNLEKLTRQVANGHFTFLSPWWDPISESAKDLISHLLTVDVSKRYDINQFFEHPWVKSESNAGRTKQSSSLATAEVLVNPIEQYQRDDLLRDQEQQPRLEQRQENLHKYEKHKVPNVSVKDPKVDQTWRIVTPESGLISPSDNHPRKGATPSAQALREVFDVSYTLHRMSQEGAHPVRHVRSTVRRQDNEVRSNSSVSNTILNAAGSVNDVSHSGNSLTCAGRTAYWLSTLPETIKEEGDTSNTEEKIMFDRSFDVFGHQVKPKEFELNLEKASILGRRQART